MRLKILPLNLLILLSSLLISFNSFSSWPKTCDPFFDDNCEETTNIIEDKVTNTITGKVIDHITVGIEAYDARDYVTAFNEFKKAAEHHKAQLYLGRMYERGQGVEKDDKQAGEWYKKTVDWYKKMQNKGTLRLNSL